MGPPHKCLYSGLRLHSGDARNPEFFRQPSDRIRPGFRPNLGATPEIAATGRYHQSVLRRVSDTDVTVTDVRRPSSFTDRAMQTTTYRKGRVLVAGDAAHIHAPLGGQVLNTGLGDAMNLGWKLAAVARGDAPDGLLDTYTTERHPIGEWVLDWTRARHWS